MQRRDFLKKTLASTVGMGLATSGAMLGQFSLAKAALADTNTTFADYKALVCVYLAGGNDSMNMIVPTDNNMYETYAKAKQTLAIPRESLSMITPSRSNEYAVGFNNGLLLSKDANSNLDKSLISIEDLFKAKRLGIIANVGTLRSPMNQSNINKLDLLPPQLFSHNDQTAHWMRGSLDTSIYTGWAGRMTDMLVDTKMIRDTKVPMNFSLNGTNRLQVGPKSAPFTLGVDGVVDFNSVKAETLRGETFKRLNRLAELQNNNPLVSAYATAFTNMEASVTVVKEELAAAAKSKVGMPENNDLAAQLNHVANLIGRHAELGQKRQVFFVKLSGWDTHDDQIDNHAALLKTLGEALSYFDSRLTELGKQKAVTTFTMSEFGRTLSSNGDGTDHGWGGHQFVMGGAVAGGNIYGTLPDLKLGGDDDYDSAGRIIPTTSSDQMTGTLLRWFGLSAGQVQELLPNLKNFNVSDLGFMKA